jgi:hypothetical protein
MLPFIFQDVINLVVFPSGNVLSEFMNVALWERTVDRCFDVAKFTTLTQSSFLISCKLIPDCWFENIFSP